MANFLGVEASNTNSSSLTKGSRQKIISQEGVNKLIYDVMSSDQGLAALSAGENVSGGFGASSKTLLAQDLVTKLVGEIANVTAEEVTSSATKSSENKASAKAGTIICTHMMKRGLLSYERWNAGHKHTATLQARTVRGYQFWAAPVVRKMEQNPDGKLEKFLCKVVDARYRYILGEDKNLLGAFTVYVLQPFSFLIGLTLGVPNGRYSFQ